jgi:hypothetical protein
MNTKFFPGWDKLTFLFILQAYIGTLLQSIPEPSPEALPELLGLHPAELDYSGEEGQVCTACSGPRGPGRRGPFTDPQAVGNAGQPAQVRIAFILSQFIP